uniref:Uncharacterized protein n=1 Tax=Trichogramma kaykai TaxID=54128 RepID=A0ABD2VVA6_9HYME
MSSLLRVTQNNGISVTGHTSGLINCYGYPFVYMRTDVRGCAVKEKIPHLGNNSKEVRDTLCTPVMETLSQIRYAPFHTFRHIQDRIEIILVFVSRYVTF